MSLPQNMAAKIGQNVGRALARHVGLHPLGVGRGCKGLKPRQHTHKPDMQMNAQAHELEHTIALNVVEILEA